MAKKRSQVAALIDNLQRKVRRLRVKETKAKMEGNTFDEAGFKRNQDKIEKLVKEIKRERDKGKLDDAKVYEYAQESKENPNYTTDEKKIRKLSIKIIGVNPEEIFKDLMSEEGYSQIMGSFVSLSGVYIGQSGEESKRAEANKLSETITTTIKTDKDRLTPQQIEVLNKMVKNLDSAYAAKGWKGVVVPITE